MKQKKLYCSLDIETSGFDPLVNEILEVGFAFFEVNKNGIKIIEEWTQVFHPSKPVPSGILGLTNISQAELNNAPKFSEFQNFLQEKLGNAIIVGHNIIFDIRFLESFGLKFSGGSIDTLDLVQWLLPTHHSYNLENLMHTFGIAHKEAHRALADSKAAISLLEKLLQVYCGLPEAVKKEIGALISGRNFLWEDYLSAEMKGLDFNGLHRKKKTSTATVPIKLEKNVVYDFPVGFDYLDTVAASLGTKDILVVPRVRQVLELYRRGLIKKPLFLPELQFNPAKFKTALKSENLTNEEVKFLLKILVWQATNWQTDTIVDLNLSFFGGQFKNLINGGKIKSTKLEGVAACDLQTLLYLSEAKLNPKKQVIVCGLNDFENAIVANIGIKTSWGYISYILKSFYNPELSSGNKTFKEVVSKALQDTDLFFGLVNALLIKKEGDYVTVELSSENFNDDGFVKIRAALKGYVLKMREANKILKSENITQALNSLESFFSEEINSLKFSTAQSYFAFV
jgi:DNA polymerase III epsilon subunit-like protein